MGEGLGEMYALITGYLAKGTPHLTHWIRILGLELQSVEFQFPQMIYLHLDKNYKE